MCIALPAFLRLLGAIMGMLDHWHPLVLSENLGEKPVAATLAGEELAIFRTRSGSVAALAEQCPHRRMRLSRGCVVGERLRCKYHGWSYDAHGNGESPGTP